MFRLVDLEDVRNDFELKELAKRDTSSPLVEISNYLLDEDFIINKDIAKKTPTVSIKQFNAYMEENKLRYPGRLTAKKHRNKKWRKAKAR